MFPGSSGVDQLVEIIKVLGSPSKSDLRYMNPTYQEFKFPNISAHDFTNLFPAGTDNEGMSVVGDLLKYVPESRATAMETVIHPFFLPHLKVPTYRLPDERAVPDFFFELTVEEEQAAAGKKLPHEELFSIKNE
jgi:serine/threonine protein kinase